MARTYSTDTEELEAAAKKAVGNWQGFESFGWHDRPDDGADFAIVHTVNRDSDLLEQSNAAFIAAELDSFMEECEDGTTPDVVPQHFGHWACGWVDGYAIRVYRDGKVTEAFRRYFELSTFARDVYPVLDEEDFGRREMEAAEANIKDAGESLARRRDNITLPAGDEWVGDVWRFLWDGDYNSSTENTDGRGAYPRDEDLLEAFESLGYIAPDPDAEPQPEPPYFSKHTPHLPGVDWTAGPEDE
jgi:hypothetical protein